MQNLQNDGLKLPTLAILLLSPVIMSFFCRPHSRKSFETSASLPTADAPLRPSLSGALDFSIGNALESITKVGVYIMIFAIFTELLEPLSMGSSPLHLILIANLEVTNGITMLCQSDLCSKAVYILCLSAASFGGLCAAAQTASMIKGTGIPFYSYLLKKLATALVTSLLASLYLYLF